MIDTQQATDLQLVARILEHDAVALGALYRRYFDKVYRKCLMMVKDKDAAFDLAEESLIKAFDNLHGFRGQASFSTWLYTITHRHCLEAIRKQKKTVIDKSIDPHSSEDPGVVSVDGLETEEQHTIMMALVNALPNDERELLIKKYTEGESIDKLRDSYALSSSAVKMRLLRTKEKLNQLYALASVIGLPAVLSQIEQL